MSSNETSSPLGDIFLPSGGFRSQDLIATTPDSKRARQHSSWDFGRGDSHCKRIESWRLDRSAGSPSSSFRSRWILESLTFDCNRVWVDEETLRFPGEAGIRIARHSQSRASRSEEHTSE